MKFGLWNKSRNGGSAQLGTGDADIPFENDLHLGKHHLKLIDGEWQLCDENPKVTADPGLVVALEENTRLVDRIAQLEKDNHRLQFKNKLLIAMCTISEGDRRVAELENEQLLKDNRKTDN